ncbi:Crp/Fnr family transcriptional regulator [Pedobacter cryoconitis]|uniref:CRP-like cAMP-binding protein n=1 Tax=Pedobacter cryoconitis TaxID=188932 RepID=A0A7X0J196_9SPHI|nr:Crp/Fnr family transcriptional regulator [Pedobacter cryoconitis]MBB6498834.1 CRP-like cAMP-binding protein [Pedobacter cryoconitis]
MTLSHDIPSKIDPLIKHFEDYLPLDEFDKSMLLPRVVERKIKRRQFILQEGDVCQHYNFVVHGCFKIYKVDEKGVEHNIQFVVENDWATDIGSFHAENPSELYIEAMEPSTILQINKTDLLFLYVNCPKFDRNFRVIIENKFIELQNRLLQSFSASAMERYLAFLQQYPALSQRIPNTQIASYLGITPEFLSKLRKDLVSK